MIDINNHIIQSSASIKEGLKLINATNGSVIFVIDQNNKVLGSVTDGDIRRGIINEISLDKPITVVMFKEFKFIRHSSFSLETIDNFKKQDISVVPVIDNSGQICKILNLKELRTVIPVDVLLMAGGRGARLSPMTDTTPKPMLVIGEKPIIEHNIDRLALYGIENIAISVRYKSEIIEAYLKDGSDKGLNIDYIHENEPLGTIGALTKINNLKSEAILVMNSDLLTNINFEDFYKFFMDQNADMAVASIPYRVEIPYGVLETENNQVTSLKEKPSYTFYSNAGIYLIKKSVIERIPKGQFYNATDLMNDLIHSDLKVCNFPIIDYWLDIGKPEDFKKAQNDVQHIRF